MCYLENERRERLGSGKLLRQALAVHKLHPKNGSLVLHPHTLTPKRDAQKVQIRKVLKDKADVGVAGKLADFELVYIVLRREEKLVERRLRTRPGSAVSV